MSPTAYKRMLYGMRGIAVAASNVLAARTANSLNPELAELRPKILGLLQSYIIFNYIEI